ncbi:FtsK/SpoIIIE domain-containing protein [Alkalihalophilus marmarensis]|uniref:FtsK/SpoIIIE domain-containing protein n=1 Tax=Alkalihalophilus marmarensis TaxID=521377 RepID=UPI00204127B9|nr:FtsK/SpoIIIE domain-containing protein [Alkalihalophilus marmarensis]MCM3488754.1 FtsK/SpoIIIE domain-containing protein [Alkalihalophilus marmarensis]
MKLLWKLKAKSELIKAFNSGELYLSYKTDNKKYLVLPKIRSISLTDGRLQYVFTIPTGLDPKEFDKKLWVFEQVFGERIELNRRGKRFTLDIYSEVSTGELTYNYDEFSYLLKKHELPIISGVDQRGGYVVYDMVTNPHLLIAGETGSGKSTQVRSILSTLIQTFSPDDLHLYLADMKRSEFHLFRRVEHVKRLDVKPAELEVSLEYLRAEAERRGDLLDKHECTHIKDVPNKPPYIVLCIDEVALLKKEKKMMNIIEELSAIGRALGIFLILSMQRPDAQVLDGKLKVNLTVRMGFRCSDLINSRIIGTPGSEKIKRSEAGLMVMKSEDLQYVRAPYLKDDKAKGILEPYKVLKRHTEPPKAIIEAEWEEVSENIFNVLGDE